MGSGNVIGYEINDRFCQISFYNDRLTEPKTLQADTDNCQIPLIIGKLRDTWAYGKEAKRLVSIKDGFTVARLLERSLAGEQVEFGEESYDVSALLCRFIEMSLHSFDEIDAIVFSVPELTEELAHIFKGMAQELKIDERNIFTQDYKESFCNYLFYQPKELWQYDAALFSCTRNEIKASIMQKLRPLSGAGRPDFVTVDDAPCIHIKELAFVYPVLNADRAKEADTQFRDFIRGVFDKRTVSSVFLTGEGFENNWYPLSLRALCSGRRAFIGNNLYSKGACYTAYRKVNARPGDPIYLSDKKLTDQITVNMRVDGKEVWYPIVAWGSAWYESDNRWELLLEKADDITLHVESLLEGTVTAETISLQRFPKRAEYSVRLELTTRFLDEKTCKITVRDLGFGDFFQPTDFKEEKIIHLGGSDGKFDSLP